MCKICKDFRFAHVKNRINIEIMVYFTKIFHLIIRFKDQNHLHLRIKTEGIQTWKIHSLNYIKSKSRYSKERKNIFTMKCFKKMNEILLDKKQNDKCRYNIVCQTFFLSDQPL